jgi:hypothetical protein
MANHQAASALLKIGPKDRGIPALPRPHFDDGIGWPDAKELQCGRWITPAIARGLYALIARDGFLQRSLRGRI